MDLLAHLLTNDHGEWALIAAAFTGQLLVFRVFARDIWRRLYPLPTESSDE